MTTEIPPAVPASEAAAWSGDVDVLVVGFGIAAGCAAGVAAGQGVRTWCELLPTLERFAARPGLGRYEAAVEAVSVA